MSDPAPTRFVIRKKLGEGAAAEVFEATVHGEGGFSRRVAIKKLHARTAADPSFSRMFLDEAKIASSLHHSGVVGVLDYGIAGDIPFHVLELVDGSDARTLAARGRERGHPMPIAVALYIVTEIARALHYVHTRTGEDGAPAGLIHRDVKPANILVSKNADVKLADFGIAFARDKQERTNTGVAKGTPGYMSPEQVFGGAFDARSDVFALGCVLHALAFGESPIARPGNVERLVKNESIDLAEGIPEDVAAVIAHAIAPLPSKRFPDAAAFAEASGKALAAHHRGDGKGALLAWLAEIDAPRAGALDAFLVVPNMVLERESGEWRYEPTIVEQPPPRSKFIFPVIAIASLTMGSLILFATIHKSQTPISVPTIDAAIALIAPDSAPQVAPIPSASVTTITKHVVVVDHQAPKIKPVDPTIVGTLAVRGGEYRGDTIVIDDKVAAYGAPHYFDLPIGKHMIELRADGGIVTRATVDITPENTPTSPRLFP